MPRPLRWLKGSRRIALLAGAMMLVLGIGAGVVIADPGHWFTNGNDWPYNNPGPAPILAAVGDISCQPGAPQSSPSGHEKAGDVCAGGTEAITRNEAQNATAMQVEGMHPALVAVLGDEQYQNGLYSDFEGSFDKYWGAFKMLQRPAPGNHEFYDNHGQDGVRGYGYFDYYNGLTHQPADGSEVDTTITGADGGTTTQPVPQTQGQAGDFTQSGVNGTGDGWYSYNLGHWHVISLNIECKYEPGACNASGAWLSAETQWLQKDLQQNTQQCIAAYWHQPTFSSTAGATPSGMGDSTEGDAADAWWKILYAHHATLILNGHDHVYTRFAPMNPAGVADPKNGVREFIIGTGGEALDTLADDPGSGTPNPGPSTIQAQADKWYGVMKFTLGDGWYSWDYKSALEDPKFTTDAVPVQPATTYQDQGTASCNGSNGIGGHSDQGNND